MPWQAWVLGVLAMVLLYAVGRWMTRDDGPYVDHGYAMLSGVMALAGVTALVMLVALFGSLLWKLILVLSGSH